MLFDADSQLIDNGLYQAVSEQEYQGRDQELAQEYQDDQSKVLQWTEIIRNAIECVALNRTITIMRRQRDSNQDPQQPKKETTKLITPTLIKSVSALSAACSGNKVAYPSCETRSQIPTPRKAQPQIWNRFSWNSVIPSLLVHCHLMIRTQKIKFIQQNTLRMKVYPELPITRPIRDNSEL